MMTAPSRFICKYCPQSQNTDCTNCITTDLFYCWPWRFISPLWTAFVEFNKTRLNLASPIIRSETPPHHTLISPLLVIRISQTGN